MRSLVKLKGLPKMDHICLKMKEEAYLLQDKYSQINSTRLKSSLHIKMSKGNALVNIDGRVMMRVKAYGNLHLILQILSS